MIKYKYTGEDNCFCIELLAYKLVPMGSYLKKGQIVEVPKDLDVVVNSLDASGLFHRVQDNKIKTKDKKTKSKGDKK